MDTEKQICTTYLPILSVSHKEVNAEFQGFVLQDTYNDSLKEKGNVANDLILM